MSEPDRVARFYVFIKWLKANYPEYYVLYAIHVIVPDNDQKIRINMTYVAPEDKKRIEGILNEFNTGAYD